MKFSHLRITIFLTALIMLSGCKSIPVKQTAVNVYDTMTAISTEVLTVQQASHALAENICQSPGASCDVVLQADIKLQSAALDYAQSADVVLAKVKLATDTASALAAAAPLVAKAQAVSDSLQGALSLSPKVSAELSKLHALLVSLQ